MPAFRVGVTIRRPRPEVAAVMFDLRYLPAWLRGIREVEVDSGEPPNVGACVALDKDIFEIIEHENEMKLVIEGDTRTLGLSLEGAPVGTIAWLEIQTERTGLMRVMSYWIDRRRRARAIADLRRLKQFIELGSYKTWWTEAEGEA